MKNCQIQHTYGEEVENDLVEEEALQLTWSAIEEGCAPNITLPQSVAPAPEGAVIEVGGNKCKWCGSTTHSHKSHRDCPYNPKKT